jgi:hypothetical protein
MNGLISRLFYDAASATHSPTGWEWRVVKKFEGKDLDTFKGKSFVPAFAQSY